MSLIRQFILIIGLLWTLSVSASSYPVDQSGHSEQINDLAFNSTGQLLASASDDRSIRIWTDSGFIFSVLEGHEERVDQVVFIDEFSLVSVDRSGAFIGWDALTEYKTKLEGFQQYSDNDGGRTLNFNPITRVLAHISYRSFEWATLATDPFNEKLVKLNVQKLALSFRTRGMALSPDGSLAAVVAQDGSFAIIDISKAKIIYTSNVSHSLNTVIFKNNKEILLAGNGITTFDLVDKKVKQKQRNKGFWDSFDIKINPAHHNELSMISSNFKMVDLISGDTLFELDDITPGGLAYSPDGSRIALISSDIKSCRGNFAEIKILSTENKSEIASYEAGFNTVNSVALSSDNLLAINTCNKSIELWDLNVLKPLKPLQGAASKPNSLSFSADEKTLYASENRSVLTAWSLNDAKPTLLDESSKDFYSSVATSSDGRWLAYGDSNNYSDEKIVNVYIKDLQKSVPSIKIDLDFYLQIEQLGFTADSNYLIITDFYHNATFIDLGTLKPVANIPFENYQKQSFFDNSDKVVEHFVLSSKGDVMFATSHKHVHKWNLSLPAADSDQSEKPELTQSIVVDFPYGLALTSDDTLLAVIEFRDLVFYQSTDLKEVYRLKGIHPQHVLFSADGKYLITITAGGRITLRDMHNNYKVLGEIQNITESYGYSLDYRKGSITPVDENQLQPLVVKVIKNGQVNWLNVGKNPE